MTVTKILQDLSWKFLWFVFTAALVLVFFGKIYKALRSIEVASALSAFSSPVVLMFLVRELWNRYATNLLWMLLAIVLLSGSVRILLEAYFRAGILGGGSDEPFLKRAAHHFRTFLASTCVKVLLLFDVCFILAIVVFGPYLSTPVSDWKILWRDSRAPFLIAIVILAALWFVLATVETLIRRDALNLLGPHLLTIGSTFAALWVLEATTFAVLGLFLYLLASILAVSDVLLFVSAIALAGVVLSVVQSYLVVVRFEFVEFLRGSDIN